MRLTPLVAAVSFPTFVGLAVLVLELIAARGARGEDFRPIKEAEMPTAFPAPTPVGEIEIKQYPAYRKASASGRGEFWTLFRHIKKNGVAMTAPVEMDLGDPQIPSPTTRAMAFLYERPDQGVVGKQGNVEVIDVPAMTVVSIGCRGSQTVAAVSAARDSLLKFLASHSDRYEVAGPLRVMAYNSPFVPRDRNYFEVQIPVRPAVKPAPN